MTDAGDKPPVVVPQLCEAHLHDLIVHRLRMRPEQTWRASTVIMNILLFQWAVADARVVGRSAADPDNLSLVLAEIGCLACFVPDGYERAVRLMKKGDGKGSHAAMVSQGKAHDDEWPIEDHALGKPLPALRWPA